MSSAYGPEIGERIKKIRESKGLSQDQLASASGITGRTVGCLERWDEGYRNPTIDTILKLAGALDIHPSLILFGEILTPQHVIENPVHPLWPLNDEEERLVSDFRDIPAKRPRESILHLAEDCAKIFKKPKKK